MLLLTFQTECQNLEEFDEDISDDELMDAAADIIPLLVKAMSQEEFSRVFSDMLPLIRQRMVSTDCDLVWSLYLN